MVSRRLNNTRILVGLLLALLMVSVSSSEVRMAKSVLSDGSRSPRVVVSHALVARYIVFVTLQGGEGVMKHTMKILYCAS